MKQRGVVILILFLMTLAQMGTDIYLPSFPAISLALHVNVSYVQLTFSVFLAGFAISQLIYGPLVDRYGRKPFLIIGVSLYFLMALVAGCSKSIELLLIARVIQGIGAGACSVIPRAIMRDKFSGRQLEKISIYQSITWSLIPITAPLLGSYIQHYFGWRYNFVLLAMMSIVALLMSFLFKESIVEKERTLKPFNIIKQYRDILKNRNFYSPLICAAGIIGLLTAFNVSAPIIIQKVIGLSTVQYGWSIFIVAVGFMTGSVLNRILILTHESRRIVKIGLILLFIATALLFISLFFAELSLYLLLVPIVILQFGSALIFPSNAAKAMQVFPHKAGKVAAIFGSSIFLGATIVSGIVSVLPENNLLPLAILYLALSSMIWFFNRIQISKPQEKINEY